MASLIFRHNDLVHFYSFNNIYIQTNTINISINSSINCPTNSLFLHKKKNKKSKKETSIKNN